jgi:hypothetical protein
MNTYLTKIGAFAFIVYALSACGERDSVLNDKKVEKTIERTLKSSPNNYFLRVEVLE